VVQEKVGYYVRCFFLCPDDRMSHSRVIDNRCEEMIIRGLIKETTDLLLTNSLPDMASKAIGYRQTLDYIQRPNPHWNDEPSFVDYVMKFTAATRQYSKRQMQWFRRDSNFYFVPVPITSVSSKPDEIMRLMRLSRTEYDNELSAPDGTSSTTRKKNEQQGKFMKTYQFSAQQLIDAKLKSAVEDADGCSRRVRQSTEQTINANQASGGKRPFDQSS
jgi:tRNA dimethylallyltransferase